MFCDQCEQSYRGTGCVDRGVCGKSPDVEAVQKLLLYGLKGMAAYKAHARRLGKTDPEVEAFIEEALFATMTNVNFDLDTLLEMALECGRMNLKTMKLLNDGHIEVLGEPGPCEVIEGIQEGPGILVSGHDLKDLLDILKAVEGTDIKVYTHGEMLPGHMYRNLREHPNLAGHYGGAWQKQRREFERFGGPIVVTTNCVLIPNPSNTYGDRLFTMREVAVPNATRLTTNDFAPVIASALAAGPLTPTETTTSTVGFHYTSILSHAGAIVEAVKTGAIKRFFVIGGCDGAEPGRNYFSDFAQNAPNESVILTLGCGKFRIRDHDYGTVAGLPRLLDMGQCNDAYGAVQVALALAEAFSCGVNDLPLDLVISWFEQKAVAVLLSLLHLGIKGIRLGPNPPPYLTPNVMKILQDTYDLKMIGSSGKADVEQIMAAAG
jgi:hydroxylamine reductase